MIETRSWKFPLFFSAFVLGGATWFGATIARTIVGFDPFVPGTLLFKEAYAESTRLHGIWLYTMLGAWTGFPFLLCFVGGLGCALLLRKHFRNHGWMMMTTLLLVLVAPLQAFVSYHDFTLWQLFDGTAGVPLAAPSEIISVYLARFNNLTMSILSGMSFLMSLTLILCCTLRPLQRTVQPGTNN